MEILLEDLFVQQSVWRIFATDDFFFNSGIGKELETDHGKNLYEKRTLVKHRQGEADFCTQ
jgi:hypothetical protein